MLDATTHDLETTRSWSCEEAREARRAQLVDEALTLHEEIEGLVKQERLGKHALCLRLGRMREDALWKHLEHYGSFEDYAVKVGAASSHTTARQLATLAKQLQSLPFLDRVFAIGKADWTKVREAAPAALLRPEDEPFWAQEVRVSSYDVVRAKAQQALGLTPTKRTTLELPLDVDALWDHYRNVVGERLGARITKAESLEHLLVSALRGESWLDVPEDGAQVVDDDASTEAAPDELLTDLVEPAPPAEPAPTEPAPTEASGSTAQATKARSRIPGPSALLHVHECPGCGQVEIDGSLGPVPLELGRAAIFREDAFVQEADGSVSRTIPTRLRRRVFARDRGACVVPGCGARGFLDNHHEGQGGWRKTGHDEDTLFLLCTLCRSRHKVHYADFRIMPSWGPSPPSAAGCMTTRSA